MDAICYALASIAAVVFLGCYGSLVWDQLTDRAREDYRLGSPSEGRWR